MKTSSITIDSDVLLFDTEQLMIKRKMKCFVVTEDDNVVRLLANILSLNGVSLNILILQVLINSVRERVIS